MGTTIVAATFKYMSKNNSKIALFWNKYGFYIMLLVIFYLLCKIINKHRVIQRQEKKYTGEIKELKESKSINENKIKELSQQICEIEENKEADDSEIEELSRQLNDAEYLVHFFSNLSCDFEELKDILINVNDDKSLHTIADKVFSRALNLVANINQTVDTEINISTFVKKEGYYRIEYSKWHKRETKRNLKLDENSFVGWIFQEKQMQFYDDLELHCSNFNYGVSDLGFQSILGIPFIIENNCKMVLCLTSKKKNCFGQIVNNYELPLSYCAELIGLALLLNNKLNGGDGSD